MNHIVASLLAIGVLSPACADTVLIRNATVHTMATDWHTRRC